MSKHWDQDPAVVAQLARMRENTIRETYLASVLQPRPGYPSDTELKTAYEADKGSLLVPRQYRLAQIFVALPNTADKADAAKVESKLDNIKKSLHQKDADFAAIARPQSEESQSAAKGGEIGWLTENQIQPEIRSQLAERLGAERARQLSQDYVARLLQQTPVSINELGLSKLLNKTAK